MPIGRRFIRNLTRSRTRTSRVWVVEFGEEGFFYVSPSRRAALWRAKQLEEDMEGYEYIGERGPFRFVYPPKYQGWIEANQIVMYGAEELYYGA